MSNVSRKQKKFWLVLVTMFILLLFASSFMIYPINFSFASKENDDYENFDKSLMQMLKTYDDWDNPETFDLNENDYKIEDEQILLNEEVIQDLGLEKLQRNISYDGFYSVENLTTKNNISIILENEKVVVEKQPDINRLIINSNEKLDSFGASAVAEYKDFHIFQYDTSLQAQNAYNYFSSLNYVDSVSYDYVVSAEGEVVDSDATYTYKSWGASYVGYQDYVDTMLNMHSKDQLNNIVVAVLDSGINTSHELFRNRILHEYARNFTTEYNSNGYAYEDFNGHGTHVSGTIAEATFSNVMILPLKVLKADGKGLVSMIVNAINYAINLKGNGLNLKVMNMSIGVDTSSNVNGQVSSRSSSLETAVENAYLSGLLPVVSAGNDSVSTTTAIPANVPRAITVSALVLRYSFPVGGALYFDNSYSNYGPTVDFSAPGSNITSAGIKSSTSYVTMSGTSMAAPHVSACVALIYSNPSFTNYSFENLETLLKQNAVDLGDNGWDKYYGHGCINISKIGLVSVGEVVFSEPNQYPNSAINLSLSYDQSLSSGETLKIYYTTNDFATTVDTNTGVLYTSAISISKTTKVTAVAMVFNSNGNLLKRSHISQKIYYFNNLDLLSSFEFDDNIRGKTITAYKGELTELNVPKVVDGYNVVAIGSSAFNDSKVEVLNLPDTVVEIGSSAFSSNNKLREIHCANTSLIIGNYSFRYCTNLTVVDLPNISSIGDYSFANCTSIKYLYLPNVSTIGTHAFSASSLEKVLIGQGVSSIGNHSSLSLTSVCGYLNTPAETFAKNHNIPFSDLTLRITENLTKSKIIKTSETLNFEFAYSGYEAVSTVNFTGQSSNLTKEEIVVDEYQKILKISLSNMAVGNYQLNINLKDKFSNVLNSEILEIQVVANDTETISVNFVENNFKVYINDELISSGTKLFKNFDYDVEIVPFEGYALDKITINTVDYGINLAVIALKNVSSDLNISVLTHEKSSLTVSFSTKGNGVIKIENEIVGNTPVRRDESLVFSIVPNEGFLIESVYARDVLILPDEFGFYHLDNITVDTVVDINFKEMYYLINITLGKGGNISSTGGTVESAAHGSSRTYIISTNEGYKIDFVSVNGQKIELKNNTFKIENIDKDYEIDVSFKKETSMFVGNNFLILVYFAIFTSIFVLFVFAKIILFVVRKRKTRNDNII